MAKVSCFLFKRVTGVRVYSCIKVGPWNVPISIIIDIYKEEDGSCWLLNNNCHHNISEKEYDRVLNLLAQNELDDRKIVGHLKDIVEQGFKQQEQSLAKTEPNDKKQLGDF